MRSIARLARKAFFFEKKKQKTFIHLMRSIKPKNFFVIKVFWFFFSKKNTLPSFMET